MKFWKKSFSVCLAVLLLLTSAVGIGWAAEEGQFVVTGYKIDPVGKPIRTGNTVNMTVSLKHTSYRTEEVAVLDADRMVDSFSDGEAAANATSAVGEPLTVDVEIKGLKYSGVGQSLKLMVGTDGNYQQMDIVIKECIEYEEPVYEPYVPETPEPIPAPMALMSRSEMDTPIKAGETRTVTIYVKNIGTSVMKSPLITFSASESLFLPGTSSTLQMNDIYGGKTESVDIKVQALEDISHVSQYLEMDLDFRYFNNVTMADGSSSGRVTIPAEVKKKPEEKPEEEPEIVIDSPVPNLIISGFHYGGSAVAAGSEFGLSFQFVNTSSTLPVENVVVTLEGGEGFTINGGTNTFYFDKIKAGGIKSVSVPMKVQADVKNEAKPVNISFKYEYVDNSKRIPVNSQMQITVPVYQPDRFEVTHPELPVMTYAGEEISIMLNYVNKGKTNVSNVEARLEGNVETYTPVQNIGNLESGKSGTIAFAVTAWEAGEANFTITITYEDANGDSKTKMFPITLPVEEVIYEDPGIYDPMPMPEPEPQTNWKLIGGVAAAAAAVIFLIVRKKKKSAALKKETELWSTWDDGSSFSGDAAGGQAVESGQEAEK